MNKILVKTTSFLIGSILLLVSLMLLIPRSVAFADDTEVYPESFISTVSFTALTDFAVGSDGYIFIDNGLLYRYVRGATPSASIYTATGIEATDCDYFDGEYYYVDSTGTTRTYSDNQETTTTIRSFEPFTLGEYTYAFRDNLYRAWDGDNTVYFDGISKLKVYSNSIYAISSGTVATITGVTINQNALGDLQYLNYGLTATMPTGTIATQLKSTPVEFASIAVGAYMTELDISNLTGEYLKVGQTVISSGGTVLVLAKEGNASIFYLNEQVYIALTINLTTATVGYETAPTFTTAKINLLGGAVYSTTFANAVTQIDILPTDTTVSILGVCESNAFSGRYYRVRYTVGEEQKTGYIPTAFLTEAEIVEDGDTLVNDSAYQIDSLVQRVILIIAIIILILVAAFYFVHIGTRPKKKSKKVKSEDKLNEDNEM